MRQLFRWPIGWNYYCKPFFHLRQLLTTPFSYSTHLSYHAFFKYTYLKHCSLSIFRRDMLAVCAISWRLNKKRGDLSANQISLVFKNISQNQLPIVKYFFFRFLVEIVSFFSQIIIKSSHCCIDIRNQPNETNPKC